MRGIELGLCIRVWVWIMQTLVDKLLSMMVNSYNFEF